jgi:hypothetical protein
VKIKEGAGVSFLRNKKKEMLLKTNGLQCMFVSVYVCVGVSVGGC